MIMRATSSGRKHGINLVHGSSNPGLGDCAFEAIIQEKAPGSLIKQGAPLSIKRL